MTALKDVRRKKENLKNINAMKLICEDMNDILGDVVAGIIPNRTLVERNLSSCRKVYVSFLLEHARKNHESNKLRIRYEIECPSCRTSFMFKATKIKLAHDKVIARVTAKTFVNIFWFILVFPPILHTSI